MGVEAEAHMEMEMYTMEEAHASTSDISEGEYEA